MSDLLIMHTIGATPTITREYTATRAALTLAAREVGLSPTQVRVLIALAERERRARSDELARDLGVDSSSVRRSLIILYGRGLCIGAPRKRGTRSTVVLTRTGRAIVESVVRHRSSLLARAAAA